MLTHRRALVALWGTAGLLAAPWVIEYAVGHARRTQPTQPTTLFRLDTPPHNHHQENTVNRFKALFGEPVALWAALQAATSMAVAFGWLSGIGIHGQHDLAVVLVVENAAAAVHIALVTHNTLLAPVVELFKAIAALLVIYGFHINTEQTAAVITVITAVFAFGHRQSTSPVVPPSSTPMIGA